MHRAMSVCFNRLLYGPDDSHVPSTDIFASSTTSSTSILKPDSRWDPKSHPTSKLSRSGSCSMIRDPEARDVSPVISFDENSVRLHPKEKRNMRKHNWRPTAQQLRPITGVVALCVALGCVFASLAVLVASDGSPVDRWPIQPTVYVCESHHCYNYPSLLD